MAYLRDFPNATSPPGPQRLAVLAADIVKPGGATFLHLVAQLQKVFGYIAKDKRIGLTSPGGQMYDWLAIFRIDARINCFPSFHPVRDFVSRNETGVGEGGVV